MTFTGPINTLPAGNNSLPTDLIPTWQGSGSSPYTRQISIPQLTIGAGLEWSLAASDVYPTSPDNTAAVNVAIAAISAAGGGTLYCPGGNYNFTGTVTIQVNNVIIKGAGQGATVWTFNNGSSDCIKIGNVYTTVIYNCGVCDLTVIGSSKTGGNGIAIYSAATTFVERVLLSNMANGYYIGFINNVKIIDSVVLVQNASGYGYGLKWYCTAASAQVGNVLTLRDLTINAFGNGAQGIWIDGACNTLRMDAVGVIHTINGLIIQNTQNSSTYYPQFIFANDLEIDGVTLSCVNIQGGREMHFNNCDFFNNFSGETSDTDVIQIASDGSHSVTNAIWFTACRIAGAQQNGVYCTGKNVNFIGCYVGDNSVSGSGAYNGIALGNDGGTNGAANSITIVGGQIGAVFGDLGYQNYGVVVASGVSRVTILGVDFANCVTGAVQDNTGGLGNVQWHGCIDINGNQLPDRLPALSSDTGSVNEYNGVIYYNSSSSSLRAFLGGSLQTISSGTPSDYRLKITYSLWNEGQAFDNVPVYNGAFKRNLDKTMPMFLAHELDEAGFGFAVTGEKDAVDTKGYIIAQQVNHSALVPVLWAMVQELRKEIKIINALLN